MGNKMEEMLREVRIRECPCGKGTYDQVSITYMDDYGNRDYDSYVSMKCDSCAEHYIPSGNGWVPKSLSKELEQANASLSECAAPIRDYILAQYKDLMLNSLEKMAVSEWHKLWGISRSLPTFRKYVSSRGNAKIFEEYTGGNYETSVQRLVSLLNRMSIQDDYVDSVLPNFRKLASDARIASSKLRASSFTGKVISNYSD